MLKWFSMRERSSRVCRESMPSFLKKSSSGASVPGASLKCVVARFSTSWVVCWRVGMTAINLSLQQQEEKQRRREWQVFDLQLLVERTGLPAGAETGSADRKGPDLSDVLLQL